LGLQVGLKHDYGGRNSYVVATLALAMTVAMELLALGVESFGSVEPRVFLDMAKLLVLLVVVSSPLLSHAPPLTVALLFLVTVAVLGRLYPKPANQHHL
jgi:hypothetical protein